MGNSEAPFQFYVLEMVVNVQNLYQLKRRGLGDRFARCSDSQLPARRSEIELHRAGRNAQPGANLLCQKTAGRHLQALQFAARQLRKLRNSPHAGQDHCPVVEMVGEKLEVTHAVRTELSPVGLGVI